VETTTKHHRNYTLDQDSTAKTLGFFTNFAFGQTFSGFRSCVRTAQETWQRAKKMKGMYISNKKLFEPKNGKNIIISTEKILASFV